MLVFTIGHSNYPLKEFVERIKKYDINCVVDIRGTPYSKYNVDYNRDVIADHLKQYGLIYIYMGDAFAAQRLNRQMYLPEGYADFDKVLLEDTNLFEGLERLKKGCEKGYRIVLLGAKQSPLDCHRFALVGRALEKAGFDLWHIMHDESLKRQEELEPDLIKKYYTPDVQMTLDLSTGETMSLEEMLKISYQKANKEIGYRVEKLK